MNIQTISIVVPTKGCVNNCPFCVSRMHDNKYETSFDEFGIEKRIKWAVANGVNTCIITGTGEALQNTTFLTNLSRIFKKMDHPFPNVELQTTGVMLDKQENLNLLYELGVNTISISASDIFSDANNLNTIGVSPKLEFTLVNLIHSLKEKGFNIRLSLNMLKWYDSYTPKQILDRCYMLGADQVTFRKMYSSSEDSPESRWVKENSCEDDTDNTGTIETIQMYIRDKGTFLYRLPFGGMAYSMHGMSTVVDDDCMSKNSNEALKYVILRENGKLYCRWDDEGSLIF